MFVMIEYNCFASFRRWNVGWMKCPVCGTKREIVNMTYETLPLVWYCSKCKQLIAKDATVTLQGVKDSLHVPIALELLSYYCGAFDLTNENAHTARLYVLQVLNTSLKQWGSPEVHNKALRIIHDLSSGKQDWCQDVLQDFIRRELGNAEAWHLLTKDRRQNLFWELTSQSATLEGEDLDRLIKALPELGQEFLEEIRDTQQSLHFQKMIIQELFEEQDDDDTETPE